MLRRRVREIIWVFLKNIIRQFEHLLLGTVSVNGEFLFIVGA